MTEHWQFLNFTYEIVKWITRQWPPDPDHVVEYYMWVDFYGIAGTVALGLIIVLIMGFTARDMRDRIRKTRVDEGRAAGPHDTADNVRDVLRDLLFDKLPWLR